MSIHELQAALRALDEAADGHIANAAEVYATARVIEAARRVAEGAGEPVVKFMGRRLTPENTAECWGVLLCGSTQDPPEGTTLYTTPPSADALVEALGELSAEWRVPIPPEKESCEYGIDSTIELTREECADALDALIAKHKENTE